jgi:thioredoxin reductase
VTVLEPRHGRGFSAELDDGGTIKSGAVVIATGVQYRKMPWSGLEDFEGAGVYYAATETEARYVAGEPVIVVGGGNSAGQAAMYLSRVASHVHLLVRGTSLAASMSDYLSARLEADPAITIHFGTEITSLSGAGQLECVSVRTDGHHERHRGLWRLRHGRRSTKHGLAADACPFGRQGFRADRFGCRRPKPIRNLDTGDIRCRRRGAQVR